ncbi:hypothetical protein NQZ68_019454 [Dissostichus eleginoides]|nr:hypothetical protein NQZ68_019454 [Dissostichus eleginoides]
MGHKTKKGRVTIRYNLVHMATTCSLTPEQFDSNQREIVKTHTKTFPSERSEVKHQPLCRDSLKLLSLLLLFIPRRSFIFISISDMIGVPSEDCLLRWTDFTEQLLERREYLFVEAPAETQTDYQQCRGQRSKLCGGDSGANLLDGDEH